MRKLTTKELEKEARSVKGFMCGVDWDFEIGHAADGNRVYPSISALKKYSKCWTECGIYEVEVRFKRTVRRRRI